MKFFTFCDFLITERSSKELLSAIGNRTLVRHGPDMTDQCVVLYVIFNATLTRVVFGAEFLFEAFWLKLGTGLVKNRPFLF